MNKVVFGWMIMVFVFMAACKNDDKLNAITIVESDFETEGAEGWAAGFAEYDSVRSDSLMEFRFENAKLPKGLDTLQYALRIQGFDPAKNLFMYMKKKVSGFIPNKAYIVTLELILGSTYANEAGGQGASIFLKAGATGTEPNRRLNKGFYEFNLNKGSGEQGGIDLITLGNIGNENPNATYRLISRSNLDLPIIVRANSRGELWLCIGTDSVYKGLTILYYDRIKATFTEQTAD